MPGGGSRGGERVYSEEPCSVTAPNPRHARDTRVLLAGSCVVPGQDLQDGSRRE